MSIITDVTTITSAGGQGWPPDTRYAVRSEVVSGDDTAHVAVPMPDGGVVLVQYVSPDRWASLRTAVDQRAPDLPLVSHLDDAGMRVCLRDAATGE